MKPTGNPHSMPVPTNTPWNSECMPWSMTAAMQNGVMQFSAPCLSTVPYNRRALSHHKRKSELIPSPPAKQHITEERITAHFSGMHISSSYTQHNAGFSPSDHNQPSMDCDLNNPLTQKELEEKLKNANRITVCQEIQKLHAAHSSFIPNALLNRTERIERPCTALVLWQPPAKLEDIVASRNIPKHEDNTIDFEIIQPDEEEDNNNTIDAKDTLFTDGMDTDL